MDIFLTCLSLWYLKRQSATFMWATDICTKENIISRVLFFKIKVMIREHWQSITTGEVVAPAGLQENIRDKITETAPWTSLTTSFIGKQLRHNVEASDDVIIFKNRSVKHSKIFTMLWSEMGSNHENCLYHTEAPLLISWQHFQT